MYIWWPIERFFFFFWDKSDSPVEAIWKEPNWQPTPVFLPGEFRGQRSLVGLGSQSQTWLGDFHSLRLCLWPGLVPPVVMWQWLDLLTVFPHKLKIKCSRLWGFLYLREIWFKTCFVAGFVNVGHGCLNSLWWVEGRLRTGVGPWPISRCSHWKVCCTLEPGWCFPKSSPSIVV